MKHKTKAKAKKTMTKKVARIERQLSNVTNSEERVYQLNAAGPNAITLTGYFIPLNLFASGNDNGTRDGETVVIKEVKVRARISPTVSNTTDVGTCWRAMIVYDRQNNGTTFTADNLMLNSSVSGYNYLAIAPLYQNRKRFKVLFDKTYARCPVNSNSRQAIGATTYDQNPFVLKINKKCNLKSYYSGAGGAIANVLKGSLHLVFFAEAAADYTVDERSIQVRYLP